MKQSSTNMSRVIFTMVLVAYASRALCQGTVQFNNRVGPVITRVYEGGNRTIIGNGPDDTPSGTVDWTGYTALTGSGWMAAIRSAPGANISESSLSFGANPTTTTFRSGFNAGGFAFTTATLNNVPPDAPSATLEIFVWDRAASGITDPVQAYAAWNLGIIGFGGLSGTFNVSQIGGIVNTPPPLTGLQSFNIWYIPEPTVGSLAGLGTIVMLSFRKRSGGSI
jgi:hypothetical protein